MTTTRNKHCGVPMIAGMSGAPAEPGDIPVPVWRCGLCGVPVPLVDTSALTSWARMWLRQQPEEESD